MPSNFTDLADYLRDFKPGGYPVARVKEMVCLRCAGRTFAVGTVTWSNDETRSIAFEVDGAPQGPLDGDTIYSVIAESWHDVSGTLHHDGTYPACLAGEKDEPDSMDQRRVELEVLHRDTGAQPQHIAVHVHCLD
ncbi:hypothetical protein [Micromonospora sp. NPDC049102]|uniref:hypothetical protein n=1 Tax=Micromonospora sp. NPDC049102 TaxID=3364265 RepID=UPI0037132034